VLIFLGEVPEDPSQWGSCRSRIGFSYAYVSSIQGYNYQVSTTATIGGAVPLNWAIAERSGLSSFEPSVVVPYLKDNLNWRIRAVRVSFL
jgi:tyrosinase